MIADEVKARVNRDLVANHLYTKGYDEVCHSKDTELMDDTHIPREYHTLEQLDLIARKVLEEEYLTDLTWI